MKDEIHIPKSLIEKISSEIDAALENEDETWDEESRKDWEEKMNS